MAHLKNDDSSISFDLDAFNQCYNHCEKKIKDEKLEISDFFKDFIFVCTTKIANGE